MKLPADGGQLYSETDLLRTIAEPWNTVTALLFIAIAVYWVRQLRGRPRSEFLLGCAVTLAVGGLGGALFHGLRSSRVFLLLDVVPIAVLCLGIGAWLWLQLLERPRQLALVVLPFPAAVQLGLTLLPRAFAAWVFYGMLAFAVLLPAVLVSRRAGWRGGHELALALVAFGLALFFRAADGWGLMPMGTHWLWHSFSAVAVGLLGRFLTLVAARQQPDAPAGLRLVPVPVVVRERR